MIITDETILRTQSIPVLPEEVDELRKKLEEELRLSVEGGSSGIGLAAIQIGIPKQMAIIRIPTTDGNIISLDIVNAKIAGQYDPVVSKEEGCLSIPDTKLNVQRYNEVYVVDNMVEPHQFIATGLISIALQHEIDHIFGILIKDREIKK